MRNHFTKVNVGPETLSGCRFFDDLKLEERVQVARYCEGRRYRQGAQILTYGDDTRDVFFLCAGRVEATVLAGDLDSDDCQFLTSQELVSGDMFGEISAIDMEPRSTNVVAAEECTVLRVSGQSFLELIARYPSLNRRTLCRLCGLSRYLIRRFTDATTRPIPHQIAIEILRVVSTRPTHGIRWQIDPAPKHHEIARRVGTNRSQVTRVVSRLADEKLIERQRGGRCWIVPDGPALLRHLSGSSPM